MSQEKVRLAFREDSRNPAHTRVSIFCGRRVGSRGHAGTVVFRTDEWDELQALIRRGDYALEDSPALISVLKPLETEPSIPYPLYVRDVVQEAYGTAIDKGFWKDREGILAVAVALALIHSEVSEALEEARYYDPDQSSAIKVDPWEGMALSVTKELADIVIRVADLAGFLDMDLEKAIADKLKENRDRPYKHGKAF